jgi:hypothetical protein
MAVAPVMGGASAFLEETDAGGRDFFCGQLRPEGGDWKACKLLI